jgi:translation initiation factor 1
MYIVSDEYDQNSFNEIINELDKETARIVVSKELRGRYRKKSTVIRGIEQIMKDAGTLTSELKTKIGTGGTYKRGEIILQGDHREAVRQFLIRKGFSEQLIEVL